MCCRIFKNKIFDGLMNFILRNYRVGSHSLLLLSDANGALTSVAEKFIA